MSTVAIHSYTDMSDKKSEKVTELLVSVIINKEQKRCGSLELRLPCLFKIKACYNLLWMDLDSHPKDLP